MRKRNKIILVFTFLFSTTFLLSQNEKLIIGRTTGKLAVKKNLEIRTFGFTNSLSGQVTLPGYCVNVKEGDSVHIDFWNISQGNPVSLYCKEIEFFQFNNQKQIIKKKEPVHHMEHGFYSFLAKKAGTYLYYSPENYPFNLQAGMFGIIIIQPKEHDSLWVKSSNETLWCSYEIDTNWHTDAIMGTEYDVSNKPIVLPDYKPNYFLINGTTIPKNKGLQSLAHKKDTVLLRLVNAGLYLHEIQFPAGTKIQLITGNKYHLKTVKENTVQLNSDESIELLISLENVAEKEQIIYHFIDSISKQEWYKANIPVFY